MTLRLGPGWQDDLWVSPYRLRFSLGEEGSQTTRFTQAYDRARSLARAAISSDSLVGVIAGFPHPEKELGARKYGWMKGMAFDHLEDLGVCTEDATERWDGYVYPGDESDGLDPSPHRALALDCEQADILLWNQIATDLGVAPRAPVTTKLVDLGNEISVYAYDNRGMDITSLSKDRLLGIYRTFDEWLLDYDRPRMSEVFGD